MTKNKMVIFITIFSILSLVLASTYAYWQYRGANKNFSLVVSGIDESQINYSGNSAIIGDFLPVSTFCQSASTTISFSKDSSASNVELVADMYMDINAIGTNMAASDNVYWIITGGDNTISCDEGLSSAAILNYGDFMGAEVNDQITLLEDIAVSTSTETFTVWIWIDSAGSNLSDLSGEIIDVSVWTNMTAVGVSPNKPVLDPGMIPVTIASDGTVTTVSANDPNWYDYSNKEWANIVLVNKDATEGVDGSNSREYYQKNMNVEVEPSDILAYYVWIPRYKYRIPYKKCSDVPEEDRNMEDYPECYAPYSLSSGDKELLAKYYYDAVYNKTADCSENIEGQEEALQLINNVINKDALLYSDKDLYNFGSIVSLVSSYNNGYTRLCAKPTGTVTLTPSDFNGNNRLNGTGDEVSIDIVFESANSSMSYGNAKNTYYTHPAFIFDGETIPGIWVGKFETSPDPSSDCYTYINSSACIESGTVEACQHACDNSNHSPRIIPNVSSLRYQSITKQFLTSQNFSKSGNIYGLSNVKTDAHMTMNSEWGAVAYLSHSKYGINSEIYINNSRYRITGRSGGNVGGSVNASKDHFPGYSSSYMQAAPYGYYTWLGEPVSYYGKIGLISDSTLGINASTTGNVSGIYDMSGGTWEHVAGVIDNSVTSNWDDKYRNLYSSSQFFAENIGALNLSICTLETCGGHALYETAAWYGDINSFVRLGYYFFLRGGSFYEQRNTGIFTFTQSAGGASYSYTWRSTLMVND